MKKIRELKYTVLYDDDTYWVVENKVFSRMPTTSRRTTHTLFEIELELVTIPSANGYEDRVKIYRIPKEYMLPNGDIGSNDIQVAMNVQDSLEKNMEREMAKYEQMKAIIEEGNIGKEEDSTPWWIKEGIVRW